MYPLIVQHPVLCGVERVLKSWILYPVWESTSGVMAHCEPYFRGSHMLSAAPSIFLMHLRKVMKHSNSNGCLSLQYIIPFPIAERMPKIWYILVCNLGVLFGRHGRIWLMRGYYMLQKALPILSINVTKVKQYFRSNVCLSLKYIIPFLVQTVYPEACILYAIWEFTQAETALWEPCGAHICWWKVLT